MRLRRAVGLGMALVLVGILASALAPAVDGVPKGCRPAWRCAPRPTPTSSPSSSAAPPTAPTPTPTPSPSATVATTSSPVPTSSPTYLFDDEFSGDLSRWSSSLNGNILGDSTLTPANASVANGLLTLTARNSGSGWIGGGLDTHDRWTHTYGYFEARIKIPKGYGLWPAFWIAQGWQVSGPAEIDTMEVCANPIGTRGGLDASWSTMTVHFSGGGAQSFGSRTVDLSTDFHVYAMDWRAGSVRWYLDGVLEATYVGANTPSVAMPLILDLAVGGGWCGAADATTPNPAVMLADWVRVRP